MSTARRIKPAKPYWEMNLEELREATKEFDREFIIDESRPLTPEERAHWDRIQRGGKLTDADPHYRRVTALLPQSLIKQLDTLAKQRKISRSKMIEIALSIYAGRKRDEASKR